MRSIRRLDGIRAHAALEVVAVAIAQLTPQQLVVDDLAGVEVLELVPRTLEQIDLGVAALADRLGVALGGALARLDVAVLGAVGLELGDFFLGVLEAAVDGELDLLAHGVELFEELVLEVLLVLVALVGVDPGDEVGGEVDDLLELLGLELLTGLDAGEEVGEPAPGAAQVPDVHDGRGELDVAHALAPHLRAGDLDATALADDALEPDALVLAAVALPVPGGAEDLLAEQAVLLGTCRVR